MRLSSIIWVVIILAALFSSVFSQGWSDQSIDFDYTFYCCHFANSHNGWLGSINNNLFYSSDVGTTWVNLDPDPLVSYYTIFFLDSLEGFAGGSQGQLRYTTDAGSTWADIDIGIDHNFDDICFIGDSLAWVAGGRSAGYPGPDPSRYIRHSTDGGMTWESQFYTSVYWSYSFNAIDFADENRGIAVGALGLIYNTTDGGETWVEQTSDITSHINDVVMTTPDTAWICSDEGQLYLTIDAGETFLEQLFPPGYNLSDIMFSDYLHGWICGTDSADAGHVWRTMDAGISWMEVGPETEDYLSNVYFISPDTGWVVGAYGAIYRTCCGSFLNINEENNLPDKHAISAHPNPFNSAVTITIEDVGAHGRAPSRVEIFDVNGRFIDIIPPAPLNKGGVERSETGGLYTWQPGESIGSGVYLVRATFGDESVTKRVVYLK